jgi:hypothetical protein
MEIWYTLWTFGILYGHLVHFVVIWYIFTFLVYFLHFWYVVPRIVWQSCLCPSIISVSCKKMFWNRLRIFDCQSRKFSSTRKVFFFPLRCKFFTPQSLILSSPHFLMYDKPFPTFLKWLFPEVLIKTKFLHVECGSVWVQAEPPVLFWQREVADFSNQCFSLLGTNVQTCAIVKKCGQRMHWWIVQL